MSSLRRRYAATLLFVLAALCSACVGLPDDGPVEVRANGQSRNDTDGFPYDPRPPQPGEGPVDIVRHFLDSMTANPISTSVAREFLTTGAAQAWQPEQQMIIYGDFSKPTGTRKVRVDLDEAHHIDARGVWQGTYPAAELVFPMAREDRQWRISDPPDAMVVSDSWFQDRYRQVSLYFFDPTGEILVPEPVYVPRGGQLSTVLMRGLLEGPVTRAPGVAQSFIPEGLTLDELSVPVSSQGMAEVSLRGDISQMDPESIELMTIQIAWTLRQDPSVQRVQVRIGGTPISTSGSGSDFSVEAGQNFDPNGVYSWQGLFGMRGGRMVSSVDGEESVVSGLFGKRKHSLREISVDLGGRRVAGVSADGSTVLRTPVEEQEHATVVTLVSTATDLMKPVWDHAGRIWLLDQTPRGAEVSVVSGRKRRTVHVPGVSGEDVADFLVSRDGTRLVAAVNRPGGDTIVLSRLARTAAGALATPARPILGETEEPMQIRDIGWHSPTEILMTRQMSPDLAQITTLSVDGSSNVQSGTLTSELVRDDIVRLVSSPSPGSTEWAVAASGTMHPLSPEVDARIPEDGFRMPTYVG